MTTYFFMSDSHGTFFTSVGCMDGRVQKVVADKGKENFGAEFPDTITDAGLVAKLAKANTGDDYYNSIKEKLFVSLDKHNSLGVIVHGHADCAGNPIDDESHKEDVRKASLKIQEMLDGKNVRIKNFFVRVSPIEAREI